MTYRAVLRLLAVLVLTASLGVGLAFAAATDDEPGVPEPKAKPDIDFQKGWKAIEGNRWAEAIPYFRKVVDRDPTHADAYNYLGFAYRNLKDFDNAFAHYKQALEANPKHRGAHEYIGEAYLQQNNLAAAEAHLAKLDDICFFGCVEYSELKAAIKKYKAANPGKSS